MDDYTPGQLLWAAAAAFAALTAFAAWADRRRAERRDIDKVGCMNWSLVLVLSLLLSVVCAALGVLV
jgi:hypothetical protein